MKKHFDFRVLFFIAAFLCLIGAIVCAGITFSNSTLDIILVIVCFGLLVLAILLTFVPYFISVIIENRTILTYKNIDLDTVDETINNYLLLQGYKKINYGNSQELYQKGAGVLTAKKNIRICKGEDNTLSIEAFVSMSFGTKAGIESSLDGSFFAIIPKNTLRSDVNGLTAVLAEKAK